MAGYPGGGSTNVRKIQPSVVGRVDLLLRIPVNIEIVFGV